MDMLDLTIIAPGFLAGLLVLMTHVPLGQEVVKRGIIFIDLAIAQIAGAGVIFSAWLGFEAHGWEVQLMAMGSALAGAALLASLEKHILQVQEAMIGVVFVLAATASILLLADHPHGGQYLKDLMVGNILWTTWEQLIPMAVVTTVLALVWFKFQQHRSALFYFIFAIAITASVQLVGVYLVFASLIIPALAGHGLSPQCSMKAAILVGFLGYPLGLLVSSMLDLPTGAVIVWLMAFTAIIVRVAYRRNALTEE